MIINFDPQFVEAAKTLDNVIHVSNKKEISKRHFLFTTGIVVRLGVALDSEFLSQFKQLRFIATITTGTDHIDMQYCKKNAVHLISLRGEVKFLEEIHASSEFTWGFLLSLIRKIPWAFDSVRKGKFDRKGFFWY